MGQTAARWAAPFKLEDARPNGYLRHRSATGPDFYLSSDAVIATFLKWEREAVKRITSQVSEEDAKEFKRLSYSIGG